MTAEDVLRRAFETRNIVHFLDLVFPPEWSSIQSRIIESGALFSNSLVPWAPRWSKIPPTLRKGETQLETHVKSCFFRAHDCLHQLWGLPHPTYTEEGHRTYKRSQMCGEMAVLTLTEFVLAPSLLERFPELEPILVKRNAIPMLRGPLKGRSVEQIAARLDTLLHKRKRPGWVRACPEAMAFCDDYVPMLALWMIRDFYHQMDTGAETDDALAIFNRNRRWNLKLPEGWNEPRT